jgi:hypothetical protein
LIEKKKLSPSHISCDDGGAASRFVSHEEIFDNVEGNRSMNYYEEDTYTLEYIDKITDKTWDYNSYDIPNFTRFYPTSVPVDKWYDKKKYNKDDPEDRGFVLYTLNKRETFFNNAPINVYRCWRAATVHAENGMILISDLSKLGYTTENICALYEENGLPRVGYYHQGQEPYEMDIIELDTSFR